MKKGTAITFTVGVFAGLALCGPAAHAATNISTTLSSQPIYVDGRRVSMTAYSIGGNNYVKLRDIGKAVDFGVEYDAATNSVHIDPNAHYQEEVTTPAPATPSPSPEPSGSYTISTDHWSREDFSQQANPAVFTGVYNRALYNTIRQTLVDSGAGSAPAYTMVAQGADYSAAIDLLGRMSGAIRYEHYVPANFTNYWQYPSYFSVSAAMPENFLLAAEYVQPAIDHLNRLGSGRDKVTYLNDYLCTLLSYELDKTAGIPQIFAPHASELKAACGSYTSAFNFLCGAADIPCVSVRSSNHSWNLVYVDGQWLHVDVSTNDLRGWHSILLQETHPEQIDIAPEATAFLKELLVPGSTK